MSSTEFPRGAHWSFLQSSLQPTFSTTPNLWNTPPLLPVPSHALPFQKILNPHSLPAASSSICLTTPSFSSFPHYPSTDLCPPPPTTLTSGSSHSYAKIAVKSNQVKFKSNRASGIKDHCQYPDHSLLLNCNAVKMPKLDLPFLAIWARATCTLPRPQTMTPPPPNLLHPVCA